MSSEYNRESFPRYSMSTVMEEAQRCLLCYDAPCSRACPAETDPARFIRSVRFRTLLCGEPTLIIRSGHILQDAMRRNRLTVDELLEALRGQGISDLREVKYAVLETSGQLSVLPRADCQPVTPRQLSLQPEDPQTLPMVVISDGRLLRRSMERLGLDDGWLQARLRDAGVRSPREVFLLSVDEAGSVVCLPTEGQA